MKKKTISTYRKIYKNSKRNTFKKKKNKRNTFKKKKNKRNIYKKKTKRTKGGYWGRCHNQWNKLTQKYNFPYIESVRGNACVSKLEGYSALECSKSLYTLKLNGDENGNEISVTLHMSDIFKIYESIKGYLNNTEIKLTNFIWGSEENCIKRFTEINQLFASVKEACKNPDKRSKIMPIINFYSA